MTIGTITKLGAISIIAVVTYWLIKRALETLEQKGHITEQAMFVLRGSTKWGTIFLTVLVALHTLGVPVSTVWTAVSAVLVLVAVGFVAQWSILSNSLCAVFLVVYAPFRIGDEIELIEPATLDPAKPGLRGRVVDISLLFTTVVPASEQTDEEQSIRVRVPNNMFFQKATVCRPGTDTKSLRQALRERGPDPQ